MKKSVLTLLLLLGSAYLYSQEIDLNQMKTKDREVLEKEKITGLFKKNSLVLDVFAFSNFERYRYYNNYTKVNFRLPFGSQVEYLIRDQIGISLLSRYRVFSYKEKNVVGIYGNENYGYTTFTNQILFNYHFHINSDKADLSIGLGTGIITLKESESSNFQGYGFQGCWRLNYKQIIARKFGLAMALGTDVNYRNIFNGYSFNFLKSFPPFASIGLFYKII